LTIRAYPQPSTVEAVEGEVVIDQRWTRFVLGWRDSAQPPASLTL
jgi:hypothetical protein